MMGVNPVQVWEALFPVSSGTGTVGVREFCCGFSIFSYKNGAMCGSEVFETLMLYCCNRDIFLAAGHYYRTV